MFSMPFVVVLWFIVTTEQKPQNSTISSVCQTGSVFVSCNLTVECSNAVWPNHNKTDLNQIRVQLVKDGKIIKSSESIEDSTFNVGFTSLKGVSTLRFECIWKRNNTQVCDRKVIVDLQDLPAPLQELSMSVASFDKLTHYSKMIVVRLSDSQRKYQEMKTTAQVTVGKYDAVARSCSAISRYQPSLSETKFCYRNQSTFFCSGFMKRGVYLPRIFVATAVISNHAGSCYSSPFCKQLTYFHIYGGLKNVSVGFDIVHFNVRLLVTWEMPHGLKMLLSTPAIVSIRYCSYQCWYKNVTENVIPAKISKNVAYNSTYRIQVRYIVSNGLWISNVSPWTQPVSVRIPNKIPTKSPKIIKCESTSQGSTIIWRNENAEFYRLKYEESGNNDSYSVFPSTRCNHDHCTFSFPKHPVEKTFGITVFPCSDGGCNSKSVSNCYFTASPPIGNSSYTKNTLSLQTGEILAIVISVTICICLLIFAAAFARKFKCGKKTHSYQEYPPVPPRSYSNSDSSQLSNDHNEYHTIYDLVEEYGR